MSRQKDAQNCSHAGGPIVGPCAKLVLVEGRPAGRLADSTFCLEGGSVVSSGADQVLIDGLPAVGLGDSTSDNGVVIEGASMTYIGGPTFSIPANIKVEGPAFFQSMVVRDLYSLSRTHTGAAILDHLARSGKSVTIAPWMFGSTTLSDFENGTSQIFYNPIRCVDYIGANGQAASLPPQDALAHELIHAEHAANGSGAQRFWWPEGVAKEDDRLPGEKEPETAVIGIGEFAGDRLPLYPTENQLLDELGLPRRTTHEASPGPYCNGPRTD